MDSIGHEIINEIIRQNMVRTDEAEPRVFVWSANAAEQLDGLVASDTAETMRKWDSDRRIFCGALQLLKEAGLAPGSTELIAAAERFDSSNASGEPRPLEKP
jgi:hypothetical protein